jgi:hypothetical protein
VVRSGGSVWQAAEELDKALLLKEKKATVE